MKRKPAAGGERAAAAVLLAFGLYALYEAAKLPFGSLHAPDSGFFPVCVTAAMILFALMVMLAGAPAEDRGLEALRGHNGARVAVVIASLLAYAAFLKILGFLICTLALMLLLLHGIGGVAWRNAFSVAVPVAAICYFGFTRLGVPLPPGLLPL